MPCSISYLSISFRFNSDAGRLLAWLDMTNEKLASLSTTSDDKPELESRLRESQSLQSEITRKKPELNLLVSNAQVCFYLCVTLGFLR